MLRRTALALTLVVMACLPATTAMAQDADEIPAVPALGETEPTRGDGAKGATIWLHPDDPDASLIIGADDGGGLAVYDLDGAESQYLDDGPMKYVDIRYDVAIGDRIVDLIAASGDEEPLVRFYTVDPATRQLAPLAELEVGVAANGICLYRSPYTQQLFVTVPGVEGTLEQWRLVPSDGSLTGTLSRVIPIGSEAKSCVVDDGRSVLFVSEAEVGIWRYGAEPETGSTRQLVDVTGLAREGGNILEEVDGLAIAAYPDGGGYLVASNEKASALNIYERGGDQAFLGTVAIGDGDGVDGAQEPGGVAVLPEAVGDRFPGGLVVTTDDENTDPEDSTNFKLASWSDILGAAGQSTDVAALPARRENVAVDGDSPIASVVAAVETVPVPSGADAADDPAIYIHPSDPGLHAVIGTDKTGALVVYGLDGGVRQELQVGRVNNVDVRDGFDVGGVPRTLVAASNRTDNTLGFWLVDEATGMLEAAGGEPVVSAVREVYGFCLYQQPDTGAVFAFVNSSGTGDVEQYAVAASADGAVTAELVRSFSLGTQTEGCVADDELRAFYVGEEDAGIWKYGADPDAGEERTLIDATQPDGNLVADVEGLAIAKGEGEDGYLIASSQGESLFAVYERGGDNDFLGKFRIVDGEGIDAVSGTDGIEVTTRALPAPFEGGLFVAQDDVNREPFENQNFKLVRWQDVVDAMGLE